MLGIGTDAVATPSSTRCHMDCRRTGIGQRSRRCAQRGTGGDHVVHQQNPASRRAGAALEARTRQPCLPARARLCRPADPPQQPHRTHAQRLGGGPRQRLRLIKPPRPPVRPGGRRPGDGVDARCLISRAQMSKRQRITQPPGNGPLTPVLQRMNELTPDVIVREQQRDRVCARNRRRSRINKRLDTPRTRAPPQCATARAAHFEQHAPDRRTSPARRRSGFLAQ